MQTPTRIAVICRMVLLTAMAGGAMRASPASTALLQKGVARIQRQEYAAALAVFQSAQQADPNDADALFFEGLALNRLGRYAEALAALRAAQKAGNRNRDLAFEGGWCELHLGHPEKAIALLKRYEQIFPGRGQTSEFLGRAYLALGHDDEARAQFAEAIRRNPKLRPTIDLLAAMLDVRQNNTEQARANLLALIRSDANTPLGHALAAAQAAPPPTNTWSLALSTGAGYNSNIVNLAQGFPIPAGVAHKGAVFGEFSLDANYRCALAPDEQIKAGYDFLGDIYQGASGIDYNDHYGYADYTHQWNDVYGVSVRASDEYATLGGQAFRNQVGLRFGGGMKLAAWDTLETGYAYGFGSYYISLPAADDRGGSVHTLSLSDFVLLPGTQAQLSLTYFHLFNVARGSDFAFGGNGLTISASAPVGWQLSGALCYTLESDTYLHPNTFSPSRASRSDTINVFTAQVSRPILTWLKAYVRFAHIGDSSNIPFFKFSQTTTSAGVIAQF